MTFQMMKFTSLIFYHKLHERTINFLAIRHHFSVKNAFAAWASSLLYQGIFPAIGGENMFPDIQGNFTLYIRSHILLSLIQKVPVIFLDVFNSVGWLTPGFWKVLFSEPISFLNYNYFVFQYKLSTLSCMYNVSENPNG